MKTLWNTIERAVRRMALAGAAALALTVLALPAQADKVHLKDGRVIEGEIVREVDGYVWIKVSVGGVEREQFYSPADYSRVERTDSVTPEAPKPAPAATPAAVPGGIAPAAATPRRSGHQPRAAIITLGEGGDKDMVGLFMTAESIRRAIPMLEADGVNIVVFQINSGGGALLEIQRLSDVIHNEFKPKFRTVAWIQSAISAAAMTAHCIEEIYFMPEGNYGACTGWSGSLNAVKGRGLQEVLHMMELISARGGYSKEIMRAMQISSDEAELQTLGISPPSGALSATITSNGDVIWYQDATSGEHVLNPKGGVRVLTLNAEEAAKFKFSRGTARNIQELSVLMGIPELEWVGERVQGVAWPVSKGERMQMDFRKKTFDDQNRINQYWITYQQAVQAAQSTQDKNERGLFVSRARKALNQIKSMVKNNPNFKLFVFGMSDEQFEEWMQEQEDTLRKLMAR